MLKSFASPSSWGSGCSYKDKIIKKKNTNQSDRIHNYSTGLVGTAWIMQVLPNDSGVTEWKRSSIQ